VFVDEDVKCQGHLLRNSRTAPSGIALLHLDHSVDEFFAGPLWSGLTLALAGEEQAIFSVPQSLMNAQKSRGFQYDCRTCRWRIAELAESEVGQCGVTMLQRATAG